MLQKTLIMAISTVVASVAVAAPQFLNERHAYERGESVVLRVQAPPGSAQIAFSASGWLAQTAPVKDGKAEYAFDAALLREGDYDVRAQSVQDGKPSGEAAIFPLSIAPQRNPQRFPVWNWFMAESPDLKWWTARGFNGFRFTALKDPLDADGSTAKNTARILDNGTRLGLDMGAYFYPQLSARWETEEAARVLTLDGKRDPKKPYPLDPAVLEYGRRVAASWTNRFAQYPSWDHALLSSEYAVPFALNDAAIEAAKADGFDLRAMLKPEYAPGGYAVIIPSKLPAEWQPQNGLIADDNPMYRFLQWWWQKGHGTSTINREMAQVIKAKRPDVLTWHDPYRLAPVYGSHAGLDIISTWTYGQPDIKRLSYATVLQAAARRDNQKVMPDITLFLYKRFVQPVGDSTANLGADSPGSDPFYTQGPDYTREAIWLTMAQRPDLLCFYFAGALTPDNPRLDPFVNSPESFDAIGEVSRALIEPYGPAILQTRREKPRVAVLMSAASSWFYNGKKPAGYANEAILPFCSLLMMNHVPFDVLLDEDVAGGALSNYDALVIARGDTLTQSVHAKIAAFARGGKKVIADQSLRAPIPDAQMTNFDFSFFAALDGTAQAKGEDITADEFRTRLEKDADTLKPLVADLPRAAQTDSKRVVLNTLESGTVRYIFAVNDDKTYGPRFGQWKLMHEAGVRQTATIRLSGSGAALYDALARAPITSVAKDGAQEFEVSLPASRGKLIAALPERIGKVEIGALTPLKRGSKADVTVRVRGASGNLINGTIPLRVEILDALGRATSFSRYAATTSAAGATGGEWSFSMPLQPALNDVPGTWTIRVTELLGGAAAEQKLPVS